MIAKTKSTHLQNKMYIKKQRERIITPVENLFRLVGGFNLCSLNFGLYFFYPTLKTTRIYFHCSNSLQISSHCVLSKITTPSLFCILTKQVLKSKVVLIVSTF